MPDSIYDTPSRMTELAISSQTMRQVAGYDRLHAPPRYRRRGVKVSVVHPWRRCLKVSGAKLQRLEFLLGRAIGAELVDGRSCW